MYPVCYRLGLKAPLYRFAATASLQVRYLTRGQHVSHGHCADSDASTRVSPEPPQAEHFALNNIVILSRMSAFSIRPLQAKLHWQREGEQPLNREQHIRIYVVLSISRLFSRRRDPSSPHHVSVLWDSALRSLTDLPQKTVLVEARHSQ